LALVEQLEELLQGLGVAAGRAPHDPAAVVVGDVGQVALPASVRQLVDVVFILRLRQRLLG
ncbi:MAG TPA: hypothetical protein VKB03_09560, partial [Conexibacter sp.]|nr:hypothetical protein [Conexibacter sp.]